MKLFIQVTFWCCLVGAICRLLLMGLREYPKKTEETLGGDLVKFIENAVFVVWAGILLWGRG